MSPERIAACLAYALMGHRGLALWSARVEYDARHARHRRRGIRCDYGGAGLRLLSALARYAGEP